MGTARPTEPSTGQEEGCIALPPTSLPIRELAARAYALTMESKQHARELVLLNCGIPHICHQPEDAAENSDNSRSKCAPSLRYGRNDSVDTLGKMVLRKPDTDSRGPFGSFHSSGSPQLAAGRTRVVHQCEVVLLSTRRCLRKPQSLAGPRQQRLRNSPADFPTGSARKLCVSFPPRVEGDLADARAAQPDVAMETLSASLRRVWAHAGVLDTVQWFVDDDHRAPTWAVVWRARLRKLDDLLSWRRKAPERDARESDPSNDLRDGGVREQESLRNAIADCFKHLSGVQLLPQPVIEARGLVH